MRARQCRSAVASAQFFRYASGGFESKAHERLCRPIHKDFLDLPSKKELDCILPTLGELRRTLPSAESLEQQFIHSEEAKKRALELTKPRDGGSPDGAVAGADGAVGGAKPLWPDSDTVEDIIEEEKHGPVTCSVEGVEENVAPTKSQVQLAWRALAWGTLWAIVGVSLLGYVTVFFICGFAGLGDLRRYLAAREDRERARLESLTAAARARGEEVRHFSIDLTEPAQLLQQVEEVWKYLEEAVRREGSDTTP
jgi:hypothetical protein